jgi:hypothetical protein
MKITDIEMTDKEMNHVMTEYFRLTGLDIKVLRIEAKGYPRRGWQIDVEATNSTIQSPEELGKAIEEGTV